MALGLAAPRGWGMAWSKVLKGTWLLITPVMQLESQRRAMCLRESFRGLEPPGGPATWRDRRTVLPRKLSTALRLRPGIPDPRALGALAAWLGAPG